MSTPSAGSSVASAVRIRPAQAGDVPVLHRMIHDLAAYEREPQSCTCTQDDVRAAFFPTDREAAVFALVAEDQPAGEACDDGYAVTGIAVWYLSFSTWTGRHGVWLEDLFIEPAYRGRGLGKALLVALARICQERGYPRFEWWVLDWNSPSIEFYRALGAAPQEAWTTYRLDGQSLEQLADRWSDPE